MAKQPVIYYIVTLEQGENWNTRCRMREQEDWDEHARLMDAFVEDGFIILGGPLDNEKKVLLIINAKSEQAIEARFADDPWIIKGVRRIANIERWEILLGKRRE